MPRQGGLLVLLVLSREPKKSVEIQARVSSDKPRLNAFCLVAPSVRFKAWAILAARVFLLAAAFNLRTSSGVHARRFDLLAI